MAQLFVAIAFGGTQFLHNGLHSLLPHTHNTHSRNHSDGIEPPDDFFLLGQLFFALLHIAVDHLFNQAVPPHTGLANKDQRLVVGSIHQGVKLFNQFFPLKGALQFTGVKVV